jgi:hypothetical protein
MQVLRLRLAENQPTFAQDDRGIYIVNLLEMHSPIALKYGGKKGVIP